MSIRNSNTDYSKKLILGTVQLGMPYGINNKTGKPSTAEASQILDYAFDHGIDTLDTADDYGDSLNVIGLHRSQTHKHFRLISKFKLTASPISQMLSQSLVRLNATDLYCYMYHQYSDYQSGSAREQLKHLKYAGIIQKLGVSIYSIDQLTMVLKDPEIDVIQLPVNIFDYREEKQSLLKAARSRGKEIHARSVFLQGLLLKDPEELTGNLVSLCGHLQELRTLSRDNKVDVKKAALNYVLHQNQIDFVVLGIEHVSQLDENLALIDPSFDPEPFHRITIDPANVHLLNPTNWRL